MIRITTEHNGKHIFINEEHIVEVGDNDALTPPKGFVSTNCFDGEESTVWSIRQTPQQVLGMIALARQDRAQAALHGSTPALFAYIDDNGDIALERGRRR